MESEGSQQTEYNQTILYACLALIVSYIVYKFPDIWRSYQNFVNEQCLNEPVPLAVAVEDSPKQAKIFPKYAACKSPDCVRCHKYQEIRKQAKGKLQQYLKHHDSKQLTRMIIAVKDPSVAPRKFTMQNPNVFFLPGLSAKPWWNESKVLFEDDLEILASNYKAIVQEFKEVFKLQTTPECSLYWSQNDTENGQWNIFCLYNQGCRIDENCKKCPKTAEIIEKLPHFMRTCIFGNALFSVLRPGTTVAEHYGPCNLRIRCHLGLQIPVGCSMTVAKQSKPWVEGECLLFDDSFLHSAKHEGTNEARVVLLLDFWHPYISKHEKSAVEYLF